MADTKISGLPASTTPLAGTEELPIVQNGVTRKVSVANLTAGRALSAIELTLTSGNLSVANGQGVDFSATPGTGTSELLSDYEEGTWTPVGNGITFSVASGRYVKVGKLVVASGRVTFPATASGSGANITSLPFTSSSTTGGFDASGGVYATYTDYGSATTGLVQPSTAYFSLYTLAGGALLNSNWSGKTLYFTCVYPSA